MRGPRRRARCITALSRRPLTLTLSRKDPIVPCPASALWLSITAAGAAQALTCSACVLAPAPVIGSGIPVAVGGVLLSAKLLARWRRS